MFINILLPLVLALLFIGTASGEIQLTYVVILIWALLNIFAYSLYFIIPDLIKKWEKILTFILPSILMSLLIINIQVFIFPLLINLVLNLIFIYHFTNNHLVEN